MPFAKYLRRLQDRLPRPRCRRRPLSLEALEDRTVPSIFFNTASTATTSDEGGPVIDHVHVELIFWGSGWNTGQGPTLRTQMEAAADSILGGPYLTYLSQYRASIGTGSRVGSATIANTSPASVFHDQDIVNMLYANLANQTLPDPASDPSLLYFVFPQPGSNSNFGGTHSYIPFNGVNAHYGWCINRSGLDGITYFFSHEMGESVSDPEGTAIQFNPRDDFSWNEIWDGDPQYYSYRLNGYLVQSWFSQVDHAFVIPTGQAQNFYVSNRTTRILTVNGGQLADLNDTITIDQVNGGYQITLNGEVAQFDPLDWFTNRPAVSSILVNTGDGNATVNVEKTISGRPVTVNLGSGTDTVNVSPTIQNVSDIAEAVTINGGTGFDSLFVWDQNSTAGRTFTVTGKSIARSNAATLTYNNLSNLVLLGGNGGNRFNLQGTSAALTLKGGGGTNTLASGSAANTWNLAATDAGSLSNPNLTASVAFSSIQNLTGGSGADLFVFSDGGSVTGNLDGGNGGSLDYSAYSGSVIVDLQTATATGVGGSIAHIQNVTGGNGGGAGVYNILVGNGGNILTGGNGRSNLLIAGSSASTLTGGEQQDILIGGTTAYDMNVASLLAIMDYWSSTSDDYATRVANLLAGNGLPLLDATTVIGNGGNNSLSGRSGLGLIYSDGLDAIADFDPNSQQIPVNP